MSARPRFAFTSRRSRRHMEPVIARSTVPAGATESAQVPSGEMACELVVPAAPPSARRVRDPRLGRWHDVGSFLTNVLHDFELKRSAVLALGGLHPSDDARRLLDYPSGLNQLYIACGHEYRRLERARRVAVAS